MTNEQFDKAVNTQKELVILKSKLSSVQDVICSMNENSAEVIRENISLDRYDGTHIRLLSNMDSITPKTRESYNVLIKNILFQIESFLKIRIKELELEFMKL